ncbi:MAG TPA: flagellar basal-body MS-ring/collar protein FliF [Acidimicrobiales bacterium]|nr:flagellar basal-body MS-ring/collar protein FliF [Acidimicrobiales bacterium]
MALRPLDNARVSSALERARRTFGAFTPGQKAVTGLGLVGLVVAGLLFASRASAPTYTTLFANLQPQSAGAVTQKLTADHVPYELADGGTTVLVPQADVNQERISLAEAGLPSGGTITFQTLAQTGITSSQFVQNVDYQQALEGQLAGTIESIQGVQGAQVSLVMPDTTSFVLGNSQTPSASVLVDLAAGASLTPGQVQAIVHLVASAVPSLSPDNVTVVDNSGDVLSAPGVDSSASADSQQTTAYDDALAASLTALLTRVVGPGNAAVAVHAVLDFNQVSTTTNGLETGPNGRALTATTSQSSTRQTFSGSGAQAAGVLGSTAPVTPSGQSGRYSSTQSQVTNAVGQVVTTVKQAPGQVERTSVAVLLNAGHLGAARLGAIRSLVSAAAGLDPRRGDSLVVSALPFSHPAAVQAGRQSILAKARAVAPSGALVLLILVLFALALRFARRRRPQFEEIDVSALELPSPAADVDTRELPATPAPQALAPATGTVPADVGDFIRTSPDEVAQLMRLWAQERPGASAQLGGGGPR